MAKIVVDLTGDLINCAYADVPGVEVVFITHEAEDVNEGTQELKSLSGTAVYLMGELSPNVRPDVVDSYFSQLNRCTWTAFCRDPSGHNGTIWIGHVEAATAQQAANLATGLCADAWGREDDEDIICIGVIEGNISVALWDDENHCGG